MEIRLIDASDAKLLSHYYSNNEVHFRPWVPKHDALYHSLESWELRLNQLIAAQQCEQEAYFVALASGNILGHCSLTQIVRGPFRACYMGYGVASNAEGKGIAFSSCSFAVSYAFNTLGLHRVMANYLPYNNRSARLLARLGFEKEGLARDYLEIAGKWQNHVLTALTNKNFRAKE